MTDPVIDPDTGPVQGMFSGRCRGGPLNTKAIHHPETAYRVAVDAKDPLRMFIGQVAPSTFAPDIRFGVYFFNHAAGEWIWNDHGRLVSSQRPETVETGDKSESPKTP